MAKYPRLIIDLEKVEHNTRIISNLAAKQDVEITGVTKCCCGDPKVGAAMLAGGAVSLGDSRVENLKRLKESALESELMLLRTPMLSKAKEVVKFADISLNTELNTLKRLSEEASKARVVHKVIIMVEMGDLREGVPQERLGDLLYQANRLSGLEITGLGMNLACYGGVVPTKEKLAEFSELVADMESEFGFKFELVSGGNSANIPLLLGSDSFSKVNNLRIGEGILLGLETVNRSPIPNTYQDSFVLEAEIIELQQKPSVPDGEISQNAFGEIPVFEDRGEMMRGILAVGRQDVIVEGLTPMDSEVSILGSSSDHIIVRIESKDYQVGDTLSFLMDYGGLLHLNTSQYVIKNYV